ncbi:hypothetical protein F5890DRAFT_881075 [Lentinula detonsa]|uniref:Uncharacterized protein n=1 Tax=Lentinula detonsa TaxID=2804962 RepID=A0AA38QAI8_9AGAR|nr:hypothetical protein F5890DRAFT_881075 [Lentinula detonsa]
MSAPPSPRSNNHASQRKRDRPPALDIQQNKASSDTDVFIQRATAVQPSVHVELAPPEEERPSDLDYPQSRAGSATSSLDPYYFGIRSPSDSPVPPLPTSGAFTSRTPDRSPLQEPYTPAKDPSSIDRRGLVGVGELTTPRWTRTEQAGEWRPASVDESDNYQIVAPENEVDEQDMPDSPWTIEAVDGETSEREDLVELKPVHRPLRERPSMTEESGGEEILYPRKSSAAAPRLPDLPSADAFSSTFSISSAPVDAVAATSLPPSAFSPPQRKARKRSSDEFEMDQTGLLVTKRIGPTDRSKDEKPITRKHRSVTATVSPSSPRDSREKEPRPVIGLGLGLMSPNLDLESMGSALTSSDDQPVTHTSVAVEKTPKKSGTTSTRSSFTPKRGSTSSATNTSTPTTSSRDSSARPGGIAPEVMCLVFILAMRTHSRTAWLLLLLTVMEMKRVSYLLSLLYPKTCQHIVPHPRLQLASPSLMSRRTSLVAVTTVIAAQF